MDVDMFSKMLFGKDPAEAYIESEEGRSQMLIRSNLGAIVQILVTKKIVTEDEYNKWLKIMEEKFKDTVREEFKKLQEQ